jgi:salicylate hydroxylase
VEDLPKVLRAFEAIRKPRVEYMIKKGRFNAVEWHLPDGKEQEERDQRLAAMTGGLAPDMSSWDGKNVDDPPKEDFGPMVIAYLAGYNIFDYVSCVPILSK